MVNDWKNLQEIMKSIAEELYEEIEDSPPSSNATAVYSAKIYLFLLNPY